MEFKFNVNACLKDEITVVDRNNPLLKCNYQRSPIKDSALSDNLREIIETLGVKSAVAQGLGNPITSCDQLISTDQRLYLLKQSKNSPNGKVVGMLKVGKKKLFFLNYDSQQVEVTPLCVLDFYVSEACQRQGYGLKLFNFMLQAEKVLPEHIAVDRPSPKMLAFYKKQFNLSAPLKQPNHFVVFRDFFKGYKAVSSKRWTDHQKRGPIFLTAVNNNSTVSTPKESNRDFNNVSTPKESTREVIKDQPKPHKIQISEVEPVPIQPASIPVVEPVVIEKPSRQTIHSAHDFRQHKEPILPNLLEQPLSRLGITMTPPLTKSKISAPYPTPYLKNNKNSVRSAGFWSRNDLMPSSTSYVVGGSDQSISAQSRYLHYGKPRPF